MARVAEPNRAHFSIVAAHDEQREIVIDGSTRRAAIFRKAHAADSPLDARGPNVLHRREGDLFEIVRKLAGVAVDASLVLVGNRHAKKRGRNAAQHRRSVRMRGGDREPLAAHTELREPLSDGARDFIRHAEIVRGDEDRRAILLIGESDRLGPNALRDSLGFRAAKAITTEPHRVVRRDVHLRDADAEIGCERRSRDQQHDQKKDGMLCVYSKSCARRTSPTEQPRMGRNKPLA